ncbi:MAG: rhomboid family intramembrane serine protease [Proteobacteria bacterium]|nr:rhomboid family intramembrane serine protease [Pseudomonadota bacterium]
MDGASTPEGETLLDHIRARRGGIPVTWALIAVNTLIFLAMLRSGAGFWYRSSDLYLAWGANYGPATGDGQWWRLGTAMFLHFGLIHLGMNMLALWDAGRLAEKVFGSIRFLFLYLGAGLAGNLFSLVTHDGQTVSGGASGAIFGLYGALLVFAWCHRRRLHPAEFRWLFWGAGAFALVMIGAGQWLAVVDNAAHVGGFMAGAGLGVLLMPIFDGPSSVDWKFRSGAGVLLASILTALALNIPAPSYRWSNELAARKGIERFLRQDAEIASSWQAMITDRQRGRLSFSQLAGEVDTRVADRYEDSFEQISRLNVDPAVPSAALLDSLQTYAARRRDAARDLAEGLRGGDALQIESALKRAQDSGRDASTQLRMQQKKTRPGGTK